jgi:hypothetical protein
MYPVKLMFRIQVSAIHHSHIKKAFFILKYHISSVNMEMMITKIGGSRGKWHHVHVAKQ